MNLYYDTEFTGLHKSTTLISIGIVAQNNSFFYAELTDFDVEQCDQWIEDNVLTETFFLGIPEEQANEILQSMAEGMDENSIVMYGTKEEVSKALNQWLSEFNDNIQFISDVCHLDHVLLVDLLTNGKTALDLPDYICPDSLNINSFIAVSKKITNKEAFDIDRESIIDTDVIKENLGLDREMKHNSLWDAFVIKDICSRIRGYLLWEK